MKPLKRDRPMNVAARDKGKHVYIMRYDDANWRRAISHLGTWAAHPELNFDWRDAMDLAHRIRQSAPAEQ